ncbi:RNA polymerase sigma factor [Thalassolituus sp. LLYu03]|uniref:RNA polymerase sigma factor n=1 Tax=Thalassolituus sp. LLYu03 TaxID=3421656 RepID=UPI003D290572
MKYLSPLLQALEEHESALRTFIRTRVSCPHTAADLFQQMTEKLLRKRDNDSIDNPRAYLYQTARNELITHYRGTQTRESYEQAYASQQETDAAVDIEETVIVRKRIETLNQALNELPPLTRRVFWLYRIEHKKQKDIAAELDVSLSSVEKHLAHAMKHCRQRLRQPEGQEP